MHTDTVEFSVIVPAFNEAANIARSLAALEAQTLFPSSFEVIVVDNGSTDGTIEEATKFASRLPLKIVSRTGCNVSAVRNHGAALSRGRILSFLDADCIPPTNWLERSRVLAPPNAIWGAHYLVPPNSTWVGKVWFEYQATAQEGEVSFIPASNLFIRRTDFTRIGGFGESLETSEDVEICMRAKKHGMVAIAFPSLAVFHEGTPQTLRHFYRQNRWHGTNVLRIFFENLPSTRNLPLVVMSLYILVMFWLALIAPLLLIPTHHVWLWSIMLLLLILPAVLLSLRKTITAGHIRSAPPLFVLYMTYLLARAASLTRMSGRNHR